ncbi:MAG: SGNH/GDSL hydrolase family protein [Planctomycetaceae bacterium]
MDATRLTHRRALRLLAIGDCNTEGCRQLPRQASIPAQVAMSLEQRGYIVDVQNWGCTMSTTREGLARLQAQPIAADLVLINFGLVDAWVTTIPKIYIPYYPDSFLRKWGRKILKMVKRRLRHPRLERFVPQGEVVSLAEYRANIERMISAIRSANPDAEIVLWGTVPVQHDEIRNRKLIDYNNTLRELAQMKNIRYIEAGEIVKQLPVDEAYLDAVHLSEPALRLIADAIMSCVFQTEFESQSSSRIAA